VTLIYQSIDLLLHFIAIKMNAIYADQAGAAKTAVNPTYAQVSKEAERLNLGGTMIYIDPASHLIVFSVQGMDLGQCLMIDPVNRNIINVNAITDISGNQICPAAGGTF
jgi:uncharacterized protein with PIN domain